MSATLDRLTALCCRSTSASEVSATLRRQPFSILKSIAGRIGVKVDGTKEDLVVTLASFAIPRQVAKEIESNQRFEAWAADEGLPLRRKTIEGKSGYYDYTTHTAWLSWQASQAAPQA